MSKEKLQALSPSETEILSILWSLERATVQNVCDHLPKDRDITYATVQTLLRRMEKKGYITHKVKGKTHVFFAREKKESVINRSITDFVNRLFGGDPAPLLHHLAKHGDISDQDIKELKKIIKKNK